MIRAEGPQLFRTRLVASVLSNRPLVISKIRELDERPGVTDYEVSFASLVDKLTNGTAININETGTTVGIKPGYILGGVVEHECEGRAVGYFLEGVLPMCLFAKQPVQLTLTGVTNDDVDICVDLIKAVSLRLLVKFGLEQSPELTIRRRGLGRSGSGEVVLTCPIVRELKAIQLQDPGFVRKVRGLAYAVRVSPQFANRMASATRGVFNDFLPDVYINTDHDKSRDAASGYGLSVVTESTTNCFLGAKRAAKRQSTRSQPQQEQAGEAAKSPEEEPTLRNAHPGVQDLTTPEDLGTSTAHQVLEEIKHGGCVDTSHQPLLFMLMALCPEDVSRARVGPLTPHAVAVLRAIRDFLGVTFKLKTDPESATVLASCVGVGYKNLSRKVT